MRKSEKQESYRRKHVFESADRGSLNFRNAARQTKAGSKHPANTVGFLGTKNRLKVHDK